MARIKLIIGKEERDILTLSTGYFYPDPNDPAWGDPDWEWDAERLLKELNEYDVWERMSWEVKMLALRIQNKYWRFDDEWNYNTRKNYRIERKRRNLSDYCGAQERFEDLKKRTPPQHNPDMKDFNKHEKIRAYRPPRNPFLGKTCPFGGLLDLVIEATDNDDFFYHAFKEETYFNGRIEIYHASDDDLPIRSIEFWDAFICEISEHFVAYNGAPMLLRIEISPATARYNKKAVFQKSWYETEIDAAEVKPYERPQPEITRIYWIDTNKNQRELRELKENEDAILCIEVEEGGAGTTIDIAIEADEGRAFEDGSTKKKYTDLYVDNDNTAYITNFLVKYKIQNESNSYK
jgi:hypothetical protein